MLSTLLLIFVFLLNHPIACEPSIKNPNIALLKPAKQSSVIDKSGAYLAVDGSTIHDQPSKVLLTDRWPWLMVDLEESFTIMSFRLSRLDQCCLYDEKSVIEVTAQDPTSFAEFPGFIANDKVCYTFSRPPKMGVTYPCDKPLTGRYVRIVHSNSYRKSLHIGELEVYTHIEPNVTKKGKPSLNNLALHKPASASSTISGDRGKAANAFDGNLDGDFFRHSCFHTNGKDRHVEWQWLMVDLQGMFIIDSVRIMNRIDCCQYRAQNFTIEMSQEDPTTLKGFPGNVQKAHVCHRQIEIMTYTKPVVYMCDRPILARYVRIVKSNKGIPLDSVPINICELEVFGNLKKNHYKKISTSRFINTVTFPRDRRYVLKCTHLHGRNTKNIYSAPYIHVDLDNGRCRFLQSEDEKATIPSANWAVYKLNES